jgi:hypothetical protein
LPYLPGMRTALHSLHLTCPSSAPLHDVVLRKCLARWSNGVQRARNTNTILALSLPQREYASRRMEPRENKWRLTSYRMRLLAWRRHRACIHIAHVERLLADSGTCIHCPITHSTANRCFRQVDAGPGKGRGEPAENCRIGLLLYESRTMYCCY